MRRANDFRTIVRRTFTPRVPPEALSPNPILSQVAEWAHCRPPTCIACGVNKAETAWLVSPIGSVDGVCARCAELRRSQPTTEIADFELKMVGGPGLNPGPHGPEM
jgi:hypothetical protein